MNLLFLMFRHHRRALLAMFALTFLSGALGLGVLAYINHFLLGSSLPAGAAAVGGFLLLVVLHLASTTWAQARLARLGHRFVCTLQAELVKRILDTTPVQLQLIGKPRLLASLGNDIRSLSLAFARLPELLQGLLFVSVCVLYLLWLSPKLFVLVAVMMLLMAAGSHWAVQRHYRYFAAQRRGEDALYGHYQTVIDGHKELALNRYRAERLFRQDFLPAAVQRRDDHIRADTYHVLAVNWGNSVMLALVGLVFYGALFHAWADAASAALTSMTVLFMRTPLMTVIGGFPTLVQSRVALETLAAFDLAPYRTAFHDTAPWADDWREIRLENVCYRHPGREGGGFALAPVNLTLKRGETVFLIGHNGSGKSTLAMLLAGLYLPDSGLIRVDGNAVTEDKRIAYRQLFASVFTEFYLFDRLLDGRGEDAAEADIAAWLAALHLDAKVNMAGGRILDTRLSQGQRKRLGLLLAALERRSLLILDEWAADQDPQFRRLFYEQLLPLLQQRGVTVFAISHDDKYFHHATRILEMKQGRLYEHNAASAAQAVS